MDAAHEPIFARDLAADHDRRLTVVGGISPVAVNWIALNSRASMVIARRDAVVVRAEDTKRKGTSNDELYTQ